MDGISNEERAWHCLLVGYQREKDVAKRLAMKGMESFVPLASASHQSSDRVKSIRRPIFPRYVFCCFGRSEYRLMIRVPGVIALLLNSAGVLEIPESEIADLKRPSECDVVASEFEYVEKGEEVTLTNEPLSGMRVYAVEQGERLEFVKSFPSIRQSCLLKREIGAKG